MKKNKKSWKTTLLGFIIVLPSILTQLGIVLPTEVSHAIEVLATFGLGLAAKDSNAS